MRRHRQGLAGLALIGFAARAAAADIEHAEFRYEDHHYHYAYSARLAAPVAAVRRVMTDYDVLARLNDDIVFSRVLTRFDDRSLKRQMLLKHCVMMFCFDIDFIERIELTDDGRIVATIVPDEGSFASGRTEMAFEALPDGSTRVSSVAEQKPTFFVPPVIGPLMMKRSFLKEIAETTRNIERLARETPAP